MLRQAKLRALIPIGLLALALASGSIMLVAQDAPQLPGCHTSSATLIGSKRSETLTGTPERDVILARGGNDRIFGRGGDDLICGGRGVDVVEAGAGNDIVLGGRGDDDMRGRGGDDHLIGGLGTDVAKGGNGADRCAAETEASCESPAPTPSQSTTPSPSASPTRTPIPHYPGNERPTAEPDTYLTNEDTALVVTSPGVLANDTDPENQLSSASLESDPVSGSVTLDADGSFTYTPDPNFNGTDTFEYRAHDDVHASDPGTVTIDVAPVPDAPIANSRSATLDEDTPTTITLSGSDPDGPPPSVFKITSLPSDGELRDGTGLAGHLVTPADLPFTLTADEVTFIPDPDFFGTDAFEFKADDGALESDAATVSLVVLPVNDAPTDIDLSSASVDEEQAPGATVGSFSAVDADPGDTHTFALVAGTGDADNARFTIDNGTLMTNETFDFETQGPFSIRVRARDAANAATFEILSISLNDVNDPPDVAPDNFSLPENSANGTAVGTATLTDQDAGQTHTWSITAGNGGGVFQIDPSTGDITVADTNALDFETSPQFDLTVEAEDAGTPALADSATITIDLTNVNEAPTDIDLTSVSVEENEATGTEVGELSTLDPDASDTFTYELVAGAGDTDNARFQIDGDLLETAQTFDHENQGPFSIRLRSSDAGNLQFEEVFSISVTDVNDAPVVTGALTAVDENSTNGTSVHTVAATDEDVPAQNLTYDITAGNTDGAFAINATTGEITVADTTDLDFETTPSFALTVEATDDGTPAASDSATIDINLNDLNEAPDVTGATETIDENSANGTSVHTVVAADEDTPAQNLTYAITAGNTGAAFQIDTNNGEITVQDQLALDYEFIQTFSLTVEVTDDGTPARTGSATIQIDLDDVNENPTDVAIDNASVDENAPLNTVVGLISGTDPDAGDSAALTFALVSGAGDTDNPSFNISPTNRLRTSDVFDKEIKDSYSVRIRAEDPDGLRRAEAFTITINNVNETPSANDQTVTTNEDTETTIILTGSDPDTDPLSFTITSLPDPGKLHVGANSGGTEITDAALPFSLPGNDNVVTYVPPADQSGPALGSFDFVVSDTSLGSLDGTVTIDVDPVNDAPDIQIAGANLAYTENDPASAISSDISLSDVDDVNLTGATVQITGNYQNGQDVLSYPGGFSITAAPFDSATGTLSLSGNTTLANYLNALEAVAYSNSSESPSELPRTVTFTVDDGSLTDSATTGIDVTEINDAPVVTTPGTNLSYTENDAATAIDGSITVSDADDTDLTGATVQITGSYQNGADVLSFVDANGITGAFNAGSGTLTLSGTTTVANYETALRSVKYVNTSDDPSGAARTVTFTVDDGDDTGSDTHGIVVTPVNDAPTADLDTLNGNNSALGNTKLDNGVSATGIHIDTASNENVLAGDTDPEGNTLSLISGADCTGTAPFTCTTDQSGTVLLHANGLFEYRPPVGFTGTDSFDYRISDGQAQNAEATGTVNINVVGPLVWYVDDSAGAGGTGTSSSMFQSLAPLSTGGGSDALDGAGNIVFVHSGTYTTGLVLENNQKLIGEPNSLDVTDSLGRTHTDIVPAGGTLPAISHAASTVITLAQGNELQDVALGNGTISLSGASVGTATVRDSSINTTGKAVDINGGTLDMIFSNVSSSSSPTEAIKLHNVAGSFTASAGTLQNATNTDVDIDDNVVNFTYGGDISDTSGPVVSIANADGGTKEFDGTISANAGGAGARINLSGNTGTTMRFDGNLTLATTTLPAFSATGGGTVVATGSANTITTTTGTGLSVVNTTIGADDLKFRSISSNGASNAIVLDNTGTTGNLEVTGTGVAPSGGTITNAAGADVVTAACASPAGQPAGVGIFLRNTSGVILNDMTLNGSSNFGLLAHNVNGFTMDDSTFTGTHGTSAAQDEGSATFCNLTGSATISDSTIGGGFENGFTLANAGGILDRLTVTNSSFATGAGTSADDAFNASSTGNATFKLTVNGGSTFTTARGDLFHYAVGNNGTGDLVVQNNTFSNTLASPPVGSGGVVLNLGGASSSPNVTYNFSSNTLNRARTNALSILTGGTTATGAYNGTVSNNQIGQNGVAGSGASDNSNGMFVQHRGTGTHTLSIAGNTVRQYTARGIYLVANTGSPTMRATITGNTVNQPVNTATSGIAIEPGTTSDPTTMCLDLGSISAQNSVSTSDPGNASDIRLFPNGNTTVSMPGYTGAANGPTAVTAVVAYLTPRNSGDGAPAISVRQNGTAGTTIQYLGTVGPSNCL